MGRTEPQNRKDAFVAFIRILDYDEMISLHDDNERLYLHFIHNICEIYEISYQVMSDRIVLFTPATEERNRLRYLSRMIKTCSTILYEFTLKGIPVRGCISYGNLTAVEGGHAGLALAGAPLNDAISFAERQNWFGITLSPRVLQEDGCLGFVNRSGENFRRRPGKLLPALDDLNNAVYYIFRYDVPLKGGGRLDGFAIVPRSHGAEERKGFLVRVHDNLVSVREKLESLRLGSSSPGLQKKYSGSMDFLDRILLELSLGEEDECLIGMIANSQASMLKELIRTE